MGTLNTAPSPLGDGEDDWTTWIFDFASDPGYATFPTTFALEPALLPLTLTPKEANVGSDKVWMDSLSEISDPAIQHLTVAGGTKTVELNLLDYYSSSSILNVLTSSDGLVPMAYQDDAIVSYARLELTSTVPLPPAALAGLAMLACLGYMRRARTR